MSKVKGKESVKIVRIGLDIAKNVFQAHGVDREGNSVLRRRLYRSEVIDFFAGLARCLIGLEACGGAHHWARELIKLGHDARLMAPQFVRPYRKSEKTDSNDAEAICEAVGRKSMRFVAVKSETQQAELLIHRMREQCKHARLQMGNQIRGLLGEFGIVIGRSVKALRERLSALLQEEQAEQLPAGSKALFERMREEFEHQHERLAELDAQIETAAKGNAQAQRLMKVPGIGPLTASATLASVGDARVFRSGRQMTAWLGITPRQYSSAERKSLGAITKRGDRYLRMLLIQGARAWLIRVEDRQCATARWAKALIARSGFNVTAVALAARNVRHIWAMLVHDQDYRPPRDKCAAAAAASPSGGTAQPQRDHHEHGLPTGGFAPVDKPPLGLEKARSACPQASPVDNPAPQRPPRLCAQHA